MIHMRMIVYLRQHGGFWWYHRVIARKCCTVHREHRLNRLCSWLAQVPHHPPSSATCALAIAVSTHQRARALRDGKGSQGRMEPQSTCIYNRRNNRWCALWSVYIPYCPACVCCLRVVPFERVECTACIYMYIYMYVCKHIYIIYIYIYIIIHIDGLLCQVHSPAYCETGWSPTFCYRQGRAKT
jgi:hypothetical protein